MLQQRYAELARQADPPFTKGPASITDFTGGLHIYDVNVAAKPNELEKGFKAVWRETERVKRFGFTQIELERAEKRYLASAEAAYQEKDKTNSAVYVNSYMQYFLMGMASPAMDEAYKLVKKCLPIIGLTDINSLATKYIINNNRDIMFTVPDKEKAQLPDEATALNWIKDIGQEKLEPYKDEVSHSALLTTQPVAGKVVS